MNIPAFPNMSSPPNPLPDPPELPNPEPNGDDAGWDGAALDWPEGVVDGA